jgi:hypothetical protein
MGTGGSFCPTGEPTGTDLLSYISYRIRNFGKPISLLPNCFHAGFLLGLFFDREDGWMQYDPLKRRLTFNCLHGVS